MAHDRSGLFRAGCAALLGVLAFLPAGCAPETRASPTVPLAFRPSDDFAGVIGGAGTPAVVRVEAFTDERPRKDAIGENVEEQDEGVALPVYSSGPEPAEFVRQTLIAQLRNAGFEVTENPVAAARIISGRLTQFWVTESGTYNASVNLAVDVKDAGGTSLWSGVAAGTDGTWGRSLSPGNYQQVLSNAMAEMFSGLFGEAGFRDALRTP